MSTRMMQLSALEDGEFYSMGELVQWLQSRSRICSTSEWPKVLAGKNAFEVGEFTYYLRRKRAEHYLVSRVRTTDLIVATEGLKDGAGQLVWIGRLLGIAVVLAALSVVGGILYLCLA